MAAFVFLAPLWLGSARMIAGRAEDDSATTHWAYRKLERPPLPVVSDVRWPRNGIDCFVASRLDKEGLKPTAEADRATIIRRLSLDLTGLPPTIAEVDDFVNDPSPEAYEKVVDRLLASPRYGERWARPWLDAARYADTNGYEKDRPRSIWLWRDWVINALNADMPFDQFTIEQLAGDLLPNATLEQKIATGFHRNTLLNDEGGIDAEEFRVVAVKDRVDATATVWLGTTLDCAQCHNHKYDPFSQREYYEFYAFFNQTADSGVGNGPELVVPTKAERERIARLRTEIAVLEKTRESQGVHVAAGRAGIEAELTGLRAQIAERRKELASIQPTTTMVLVELPKPRENFIMPRGNFNQKGKPVEPGTPKVLHPFPENGSHNRVGIAQWLVHRDNPLTARVTVNRHWQAFFGHGLVQTTEDFGSQGELPTHPQLLDWLAVEFMERGWSTKALHRLIVTSATYRQSSRLSPELKQRDPDNLLYARGSRLRVEYETLRDLALSVGGLLSNKIGGPSVMPPQPPGIWENSFGFYDLPDFRWKEAGGDDRYRRGIYVFLRRTAMYPTFVMFDAPGRDVCSVKRPRTNTPLQALATLNDPVFVEAAAGLARRIMTEADGEITNRLRFAFRVCLSREPRPEEMEYLTALYRKSLAKFQSSREPAESLLHSSRVDRGVLNPVELAAWTVVANVLLNLDETLCKG